MTIPHHLASTRASGDQVNEPIAQFEIGSYKNFVYLILKGDDEKILYTLKFIISTYAFDLTQLVCLPIFLVYSACLLILTHTCVHVLVLVLKFLYCSVNEMQMCIVHF